jgi:DNA-directed RNA polymerase subunit RPC12/RpoP
MSIKFHCEHCGKRIDAPDTAGGKRGKCPACHNKIYVPQMDAEEDEELKLAPIDETEGERQKRLLAETFQLTQHILQEKDMPDGPVASGSGSTISEEELTAAIVRYLRQMADGNLDDAQRTAEIIAAHRLQAKGILDPMAHGELPDPELQNVPAQVLNGLIRNLRTRIS